MIIVVSLLLLVIVLVFLVGLGAGSRGSGGLLLDFFELFEILIVVIFVVIGVLLIIILGCFCRIFFITDVLLLLDKGRAVITIVRVISYLFVRVVIIVIIGLLLVRVVTLTIWLVLLAGALGSLLWVPHFKLLRARRFWSVLALGAGSSTLRLDKIIEKLDKQVILHELRALAAHKHVIEHVIKYT